ncbi:MAG: regulatory iron-sulfur-containing complex subunit RicT [Cruoricaptor ignavus]|nr:regulatory iron-sulfur-containing complex subunit RicT [Cruoricaptor ignavus]
MSCGCKTSGDSGHSCGTKSATGCENVNICGNSYKLSVFDWLSNIKNPNQRNEDEYIEVRFKNDRKLFFKNPNKMPLHIGSIVTVESSPGHDVGVVSLTGELVKIQMKKKKFPEEQALKIYRIANQKDVETWQTLREKENATKKEAKIIASRLGLEMKITDVEYQGDGAKATFYYTAESRVDFRQLIKEFATLFKTKIDMKQIGFRQESAKIGGIGSCGRELCCSSWLTDFRSVNTNAARYQQLSINPQKLAGQCGKLKCCLNFELDSYMDALSDFPSSGTTLDTEKGKAFCIKIDVFKKKMWFAYADNPVAWYDVEVQKVKQQIEKNKKGIKASNLEDLVSNDAFTTKTVDLIQEDSPDRFEKKGRQNRKPNNKNRKDRPANNNQPKQTQNRENQKPQERKPNTPQERKPNQPNNKGKRNYRKPNPPKNNADNNE